MGVIYDIMMEEELINFAADNNVKSYNNDYKGNVIINIIKNINAKLVTPLRDAIDMNHYIRNNNYGKYDASYSNLSKPYDSGQGKMYTSYMEMLYDTMNNKEMIKGLIYAGPQAIKTIMYPLLDTVFSDTSMVVKKNDKLKLIDDIVNRWNGDIIKDSDKFYDPRFKALAKKGLTYYMDTKDEFFKSMKERIKR